MTITSIQDILPLVEMPSRYLGTEINRVKKNLSEVDLRVALAFPDLYEIGSSHFGIQILYHILNQFPNIAAERVFAPAPDMEKQLRLNDMELFSLESRYPLKKFDILGFSLLYELTYTNVLNMLQLSHIPFRASQRDLAYPLIIAGGPCTCNPEPMAYVFDAMVIGDGEEVIVAMCDAWRKWHRSDNCDKNDLLSSWADIKGVYIPCYHDYCGKKVAPAFNAFDCSTSGSVKRAVVKNLDETCVPQAPLIPFGKPVHDRLRLEVARGCSRGCRFCQAGMIYRPVRERSQECLIKSAHSALKSTGYEDLSLLSLSTGDYGCIDDLMKTLMRTCEREHVAISLPSLRAGTISENLMEQIKKVRKTGFTIAPEAGSQRLRNVINKNISEQDIIQTVQNAFELGWHVIKLYFMVGLPTENKDDLDAIVDLVKKIRMLQCPNKRKRKINVSVTTFIPKSHTPFQWAPQISREHAWKIITYLKDQLHYRDVQFKWQNPDVSMIEGMMARGDRQMYELILAAFHNGSKFDGWNDHFSFEKWQRAFEQTKINPQIYTDRQIDPDESLPWDHIDIGITKKFLLDQWEKANSEILTEDCRWQGCEDCGICDFENLAPIVYTNNAVKQNDISQFEKKILFHKLNVFFSKKENARFLGHLEMVRVFLRAIKRSGIQVDFSNGFHPMPKVSFDNPLPLGTESECERFTISVATDIIPEKFKAYLNEELPEGLLITKVGYHKKENRANAIRTTQYQISIKDGFFDQNRLHSFMSRETWTFEKITPKGKIKILDLKKIVAYIKIDSPKKLIIDMVEEAGKVVRPIIVMEQVFGFQNEQSKLARVLKLSISDE